MKLVPGAPQDGDPENVRRLELATSNLSAWLRETADRIDREGACAVALIIVKERAVATCYSDPYGKWAQLVAGAASLQNRLLNEGT